MAIDGALIWGDRQDPATATLRAKVLPDRHRRDANGMGLRCAVVEGADRRTDRRNSRAELAGAEALFQDRRRALAMEEGATLIDPKSVFFSADTVIRP